ncbi:hypothetical protein ACHAWO_004625 [Cyclotella atomus]|uniref:PiggyBac transposable element-derived protein domain-containing protein n=1 Tax=Cyclotella atomus TaxID=382360 RepID=A0ABD3NDF1_9STRA
MARSKRKPAGIGAIASCKAKFFHPKKSLQEQYAKHTYDNVLIIGKGRHRINHREQDCYECRIPDIDESITFKIVKSHVKVTQSPNEPFDDEVVNAPVAPSGNQDDLRGSTTNVSDRGGNYSFADDRAETIAALRAQGIEVDDEDVLPENIAPPSSATGTWQKPNTCPRRSDPNVKNSAGNWKSKSWAVIREMDNLSIFRMAMPEKFIQQVMIPETNKHLEGERLTLSEFYRWLGCRYFAACFVGVSPFTAWWSSKEIDQFEGAPFRLNCVMSYSRFNAIDKAIRYTNVPPPTEFEDKFHDVRQMIDAFNQHYEDNYTPSWLSCLDESMNTWLNKNCPGFMVVPRKPHPEGNECHTIADGDKNAPIMWRVKLQEGKDRPKLLNGKPAFPSQFEIYSKTAKLMLEMTKPIHGTGKVISMDSGFCVTAGILAMRDAGVYWQALIKNEEGTGRSMCLAITSTSASRTRSWIDGKQFLIHCHKEEKYVCKVMSSHALTEDTSKEAWRKVNGEWESFKYTEAITNHNKSKHWVDDVNNRRHAPIGLEDVWATQWWPHRQFTFLCSVAEVNANNSKAQAHDKPAEHQIAFRKQLAKELMFNRITESGGVRNSPIRGRRAREEDLRDEHRLVKKPKFTGRYDPTEKQWVTSKVEYLKQKCKTCPKEVRTYCLCSKATPMCADCFGKHYSCVDHAY